MIISVSCCVCVHREMTVSVEVIPIAPAGSGFKCSLLRVDDSVILLDCGWNESLDPSLLVQLTDSELFPKISACVLTHADLAHSGALPFLVRAKKMTCPIFATSAVKRLGELTAASLHEDIDGVRDVVVSGGGEGGGDWNMTLEEIVGVWQMVVGLQWGELIPLILGQNDIIKLCPHRGGRLLGSAFWIFEFPSHARIAYCVDYQLATGRVLPGLEISSLSPPPSLLITDVGEGGTSQRRGGYGGRYSAGEEALLQSALATLRKDGTVLIPTNSTGRVLELLCLLEDFWASEALPYPVVFVSPLGDVVLDQAKTRMEWLSESVLKQFNDSASFTFNPFLFKHIQLCTSAEEFLEKFPGKSGRVILASSASLEVGDSRDLFFRIAGDPSALVVLTGEGGTDTLAGRLAADPTATFYNLSDSSKSALPDEQLREVYRDALLKETTEDELRRRRARERRNFQLRAAGMALEGEILPPVDLTHLPAGFEGTGGESFFRPRLFYSQTLAATIAKKGVAVVGSGGLDEYGEAVTTTEVDTWRAHADAEGFGVGGVGDEDENDSGKRAAPEIKKQVKRAKEELGIKQDLDEKMPLEELREGGGFDWRRDLYVRFGEPRRVEKRERQLRVSCRVKLIPGLDGSSSLNQRREFLNSVAAHNVVFLPSTNLPEIELLGMRGISLAQKYFFCQEEAEAGSFLGGGGVSVVPVSRTVELHAIRKVVHIDPILIGHLNMLPVGVKAAVASLEQVVSEIADHQVPDLIRNPFGSPVELVLVPKAENSRLRRKSLLLSDKRVRAADLRDILAQSIPNSYIGFTGNIEQRALKIQGELGEVIVTRDGEELRIHADYPNPAMAAVRQALYKHFRVV